MVKYSYEFKKKVVMDYVNGKGGYGSLSKEYNIPDKKQIYRWVSVYKEFGEEGLKRSREKKNYTFEFKQHVVELYLTTEVSYQELALSVGMYNPAMISKWVNDYRAMGADALHSKRKGRKPQVAKQKETTHISEKADSEYLKQLEEENLKLRIENAYLKELRRLRMEGQKPPRKRQE